MNNKLNEILETSKFVVNNAKHVKINYDKVDVLIDELLKFNNVHYLTKLPYAVYEMSTKDLVNFLLVYDSIDFSFWGNPKWTVDANGKNLDGGIALLYCIFNLFNGHDSVEVFKQLENITISKYKTEFDRESPTTNIEVTNLSNKIKVDASNSIDNENIKYHYYSLDGENFIKTKESKYTFEIGNLIYKKGTETIKTLADSLDMQIH